MAGGSSSSRIRSRSCARIASSHASLSIVPGDTVLMNASRLPPPSDNAGPVACIVLSGGGGARPPRAPWSRFSFRAERRRRCRVRPGHELAVRPDTPPPNAICVLVVALFGVTRAPTERVPAGVVPGHERRVQSSIVSFAVRSTASSSSEQANRRARGRAIVVVVVESSIAPHPRPPGVARERARDRGRVGRRRPPRPRTRRTTRRPPCRRFREPAETTRGHLPGLPAQCDDGDSQRPGVLTFYVSG